MSERMKICKLNILFILLFFFRCDVFKDTSQGEIKYKISYPDFETKSLMINIFPSEMTLKFKGNKTKMEFEIGLGMFKMTVIADSKEKIMFQLAKMMTKKYALKLDSIGIEEFNKLQQQEMDIKIVDETKKIIGIDCKKAIVNYKSNPTDTFFVYYTDKIEVINPHWNTPYKNIPGLLLEYEACVNNLEMKFIATSITFKQVADEDFNVPADYKYVDMRTMREFIPEL